MNEVVIRATCANTISSPELFRRDTGEIARAYGAGYQQLVRDLDEGKSVAEVIRAHPEEATRSTSNVVQIQKLFEEEDIEEEARRRFPNHELYPWQTKLLTRVLLLADDRHILWIWDEVGNTGKTYMSKLLVFKYGAQYFTNAATKDITHAVVFRNKVKIDGKRLDPIIIFDLARSLQEIVNYQAIEQLKNVITFSPKYQSTTKFGPPAHVIVFANWPPNRGKMSADRWHVWRVSCHMGSMNMRDGQVPQPAAKPVPDIEEDHVTSLEMPVIPSQGFGEDFF